jgi:tetratricopeptide (TPR) repeat protein
MPALPCLERAGAETAGGRSTLLSARRSRRSNGLPGIGRRARFTSGAHHDPILAAAHRRIDLGCVCAGPGRFYAPGKTALEFREVVEEGQNVEPDKVETLKDIDGKPLRLVISPVLSLADIDGIRIEKCKSDTSSSSLEVEVLFKTSSWSKIEVETRRRIGKRMAVVFDGQVLSTPLLRSVITDSAIISGPDNNLWIPKLLADWQPVKRLPSDAEREKALAEYKEGIRASLLKEGYYKPGKATLTMREVMEDGRQDDPSQSETVNDRIGNPVRLARTPTLSSADIAGILIEKDKDATLEYALKATIFFKTSSWQNVEEKTKRLKGRRLALLIDGHILSMPVVTRAVRNLAVLNRVEEWPAQVGSNLQPAGAPPSEREQKKALREWQEERHAVSPNDRDITSELAKLYHSSEDYEKAITLYEELWKTDPDNIDLVLIRNFDTVLSLGKCYTAVRKYDEALRCFETVVKYAPYVEYLARSAMANIHDLNGDKPAALREMDKAIKALESSGLQDEEKAKALRMLEKEKARLGSL